MFAIGLPGRLLPALHRRPVRCRSAEADALVDGLQWRTYFMISMATYAAIGAALGGAIVIAQERDSGWTRQLRVTPLPSIAYVTGKLVVSYVVTVPAVAAVLLAGLAVNHVELPAAELADRARDAGDRRAAVRGARAAGRLPVRRQQRPGRDDDLLLRPGDPRRAVGAASRRSRTPWLPSVACFRRSALPTSAATPPAAHH